MSDSDKVYTGKVAWFNNKKGFGFITPDSGTGDYFAHFTQILCDGFKTLNEGDVVEFKLGQNQRGQMATEIKIVKKAQPQ